MTIQQITARAKKIRKLRPGTQWKNALKQAAAQLRAGKKVSGPAAPVVGAVRKRKKPRRTYKKSAKVYRAKVRRVSGTNEGLGNTGLLLGVAGIAVVGYFLMRSNNNTGTGGTGFNQQLPPLYQSNNQTRNQQSAEIVQWATAAGIALAGIAKIIESLNNKSDQEVNQMYQTAQQEGELDLGYWV